MCLKRKLLFSTITVLFSVMFISAVPESPEYVTSDWGVTQLKFKIIKYTWTITNYSAYEKLSIDHLESPVFPGNDDDKWQIQLFLKDLYNGARNVISLFLKPLSQDQIEVKYKIALLNKDNRELLPKTTYSTIHRNNLIGYSGYAPKDTINAAGNKLLPNDALTIIVEIEVPVGLVNISAHCHFKKLNTYYLQNFTSLFKNELFSDAIIKVGSHEFAVHRVILVSASPELLAVFNPNKDTVHTVITIRDVEPRIFQEFLRFIYTGKVEGIENIAKDLLPLADKYGIEQLKILCEEALCRHLTGNSAIDILMLAQNNNAENLKMQASNFIAAHLMEVMQVPTAAIENSHPLLKLFQASLKKTSAS